MCLEIKKFAKEKTSIIIFSIFLVFCWGAALVFQHRSAAIMRADMNSILERYDKILSIENNDIGLVDETDIKLLCDDLHLNLTQRLSVQTFVNNTLKYAVELSRVNLDRNAIVAAKADAMFNETRDILDSQFLKIQHETESLQIWCALITVVFLVFSFFSLFQSGEFVKKGEEGVAELKNLKREAEDTVNNFTQKTEMALLKVSEEKEIIRTRVENEAADLRDKMQKIMDDASGIVKEMKYEVQNTKDSVAGMERELREKAEKTREDLSTLTAEANSVFAAAQEKVSENLDKLQRKEMDLEENLSKWMREKEVDIDTRGGEMLSRLSEIVDTYQGQVEALNARMNMISDDKN